MIKVISYTNSISLPLKNYEGRIHSIYNHAINITYNDSLITILKESTPMVPDSFCLDNKTFKEIHNFGIDDIVVFKDNIIQINDYIFDFSNAEIIDIKIKSYDLNILALNKLLIYKNEIIGLKNINIKRKEIIINSIRKFSLSGDFLDVKDVIGFGEGLTPASDDMIIGSMAILKSINRYKYMDSSIFKSLIVDKTTDVSVKYFTCANLGYFSQTLNNCVLELNGNKDINNVVSMLKSIGSSSGKDMLQGMIVAIEEIGGKNEKH